MAHCNADDDITLYCRACFACAVELANTYGIDLSTATRHTAPPPTYEPAHFMSDDIDDFGDNEEKGRKPKRPRLKDTPRRRQSSSSSSTVHDEDEQKHNLKRPRLDKDRRSSSPAAAVASVVAKDGDDELTWARHTSPTSATIMSKNKSATEANPDTAVELEVYDADKDKQCPYPVTSDEAAEFLWDRANRRQTVQQTRAPISGPSKPKLKAKRRPRRRQTGATTTNTKKKRPSRRRPKLPLVPVSSSSSSSREVAGDGGTDGVLLPSMDDLDKATTKTDEETDDPLAKRDEEDRIKIYNTVARDLVKDEHYDTTKEQAAMSESFEIVI